MCITTNGDSGEEGDALEDYTEVSITILTSEIVNLYL